MKKLSKSQERDELVTSMSRAISVYAACEHYGVKPVKTPPHAAWVICCLSGRMDRMVKMCNEFCEANEAAIQAAAEAKGE